MRLAVTLLLTLFLLCLAVSAAAQLPCPDDEINATSRADTIFIEHRHAERNCCYDLQLRLEVAGQDVDFFEGETGAPCDCICCFDLRYSASNFAAGHYNLRFWNGDGTEFYGSVAIDVDGGGQAPKIASADRGECVDPVTVAPTTWSLMKKLFR